MIIVSILGISVPSVKISPGTKGQHIQLDTLDTTTAYSELTVDEHREFLRSKRFYEGLSFSLVCLGRNPSSVDPALPKRFGEDFNVGQVDAEYQGRFTSSYDKRISRRKCELSSKLDDPFLTVYDFDPCALPDVPARSNHVLTTKSFTSG